MAKREVLAGAVRDLHQRVEEGRTAPRFARQQAIERDIVALNPDADEAAELLDALAAGVRNRYGDAVAHDALENFRHAREALEELWRTAYANEGPDEMDLSRNAALDASEQS